MLSLSDGERATITSWLVSEGDSVHDGQPLAKYLVEGGAREKLLSARTAGTLARILVQEGAEIGGGEGVCEVEGCPHEELFNGICASCGEDVDELERNLPGGRLTDQDDRTGSRGAPASGAQHHFGMFGSMAHPSFRSRFSPPSSRTASHRER